MTLVYLILVHHKKLEITKNSKLTSNETKKHFTKSVPVEEEPKRKNRRLCFSPANMRKMVTENP
jgi:hypothetical protein